MKRIVLWSLSGLVSALLLINLFLGLSARGAISQIQAVQSKVANGPQMEKTLRNLSIRIAMAGEKDPAFRQILKKYELKVKLDDKAEAKGEKDPAFRQTLNKKELNVKLDDKAEAKANP